MSQKMAAVLPLLVALSAAQQIGTAIPEVHPKITTQVCTTAGGCVDKQSFLVTDALARPFHAMGDMSVSCSNARENKTLCPDVATCAKNCVLEGVEYGSIGVLTSGSALTMRQYIFDGVTHKQVSPRLYLLAEDNMNYEMLKLVGQEISYDVDVSQLACGMNGALYLSEMEASGSRSDMNPAGAQYGTGYCDAQCFNVTWINGLANLNNSGSCCNEMDIWEANSRATAFTPHTCTRPGSFLCAGDECARNVGVCDKNGCGMNPYASGSKDYYGPSLDVDTSKPFTVITQFLTADNNPASPLSSIRRIYIQDGKMISNAMVELGGKMVEGTITQDFCTEKNASDFNRLGGVEGMGASLARGMVLVFSIWNSPGDFMTWLDSGNAGPCNATEGDPKLIVAADPDVAVTFSNIRWGEIGSTFKTPDSAEAIINANAKSTTTSAAPEWRASWLGWTVLGLAAGLALL